MASAVVGVVFILMAVTFWSAGTRTAGIPSSQAWRHLRSSWILWIGVLLVVNAVSPGAMIVLVLVLLVAASVQIVRGLREFPRVWRSIGDSEEWQNPQGTQAVTLFRVPPPHRLAGLARLRGAAFARPFTATSSGFTFAASRSTVFHEEWDRVNGIAIIVGDSGPAGGVMTVYRSDRSGEWVFGGVYGRGMVALLKGFGFTAHTIPSRPDTTLLIRSGPPNWSLLN